MNWWEAVVEIIKLSNKKLLTLVLITFIGGIAYLYLWDKNHYEKIIEDCRVTHDSLVEANTILIKEYSSKLIEYQKKELEKKDSLVREILLIRNSLQKIKNNTP